MPEETNAPPAAPLVPGNETPAPTANPPAPAAVAAPPASPGERTMMIPHSSMKRIKEEEYTKGKQAALDQMAKDAGYENNADFVSAMARLRQPAPAPAPTAQPLEAPADDAVTPPDPANTVAQTRRDMALQRNLEKALNERNKYANSASEYRKELENARSEVDAVRAEMHLRTIAAGVGVQDIDYAITLLTREVEKLTPEQAAQFDERAYFDGLRKSKPMLFGEMVQPANTGTGGGSAPTPPRPGQVASQTAQNGKVDARKMDAKAYKELLQARGISSLA